MLLPAVTGSGESVLVTERSAEGALTWVVSVSLLLAGLGSIVVVVTAAVLVIAVPGGTDALTSTTSVNLASGQTAKLALVHLTMPVPPTAGFVPVKAGPQVSVK